MASVHLLSLPEELLVYILSLNVSVGDYVACLSVNKQLKDTISNSILLQYLLLAKRHGVIDNPSCLIPVIERYRILKDREDSWLSFRFKARKTIPLPTVPSGIYDLTGGHFLISEVDKKVLRLFQLPQAGIPSPDSDTWTRIPLTRPVIDIGLALVEHDLCAAIMGPPPQSPATGIDLVYTISFIQASTGIPHPDAKQSVIYLDISRPGFVWPAVYVEITGRTMVLLLTENPTLARPISIDQFWVIDWMEGVVLKHFSAQGKTYNGFILVSKDHFLLPNEKENSLEYWRIPKSQKEAEELDNRPSLTLRLPELDHGVRIAYIQSRCEPNPATRLYPGGLAEKQPFHTSPESGLLILHFHVIGLGLPHTKFSLFTHRHSLVNIMDGASCGDTIAWESWGPPITRFIPYENISTRWVTTSCGQRAVIISEEAATVPSMIEILDFNPYHFTAVKERFQSVFAESRQRRRVMDVSTGNILVRLGRPIPRMEMFPGMDDFDEDCDIFKYPVECGLPYVRYNSGDELFQYSGVVMDEDNLIGIYTDAEPKVNRLDIIEFR